MQEVEAMYKLGDTNRALWAFSRVEEIYGRKGFAGEQKTFLKHLDQERARRAGGGSWQKWAGIILATAYERKGRSLTSPVRVSFGPPPEPPLLRLSSDRSGLAVGATSCRRTRSSFRAGRGARGEGPKGFPSPDQAVTEEAFNHRAITLPSMVRQTT